jgi:hypothetical protein
VEAALDKKLLGRTLDAIPLLLKCFLTQLRHKKRTFAILCKTARLSITLAKAAGDFFMGARRGGAGVESCRGRRTRGA